MRLLALRRLLRALRLSGGAKTVEENSLVVNEISGTGKDGRITKEDVINHLCSEFDDAQVK